MGLFDFLSGDKDNYKTLVKYYEEYTKSCVLQPNIFPQMAFLFNNRMDAINSEVKEKASYVAQYNRLIDAIRLGDIKNIYGTEERINLVQEMYLRIITASWIISKLNSYDALGKRIRKEMLDGFEQTLFSVNFKIIDGKSWRIDCCVQLFKNDIEVSEINVDGIISINQDTFFSEEPFKTYISFENTPKELLRTYYLILKWLFFNTPSLTNINRDNMTIGRVYADFWLKKIVTAIVISSEEWDYYISDITNLKKIQNIRYYFWNDKPYTKQIQFKFDVKTKTDIINFDYEYSISSAEAFNLKYVKSLANFVSTNHNLSY